MLFIHSIVAWIESHGYRIVSIDYLFIAVYRRNLCTTAIGDDQWSADIGRLLSDGIIEEVAE